MGWDCIEISLWLWKSSHVFLLSRKSDKPNKQPGFRPAGLKLESVPGNNLDVTWRRFRLQLFFIQKTGIRTNPAVSVVVIGDFA